MADIDRLYFYDRKNAAQTGRYVLTADGRLRLELSPGYERELRRLAEWGTAVGNPLSDFVQRLVSSAGDMPFDELAALVPSLRRGVPLSQVEMALQERAEEQVARFLVYVTVDGHRLDVSAGYGEFDPTRAQGFLSQVAAFQRSALARIADETKREAGEPS